MRAEWFPIAAAGSIGGWTWAGFSHTEEIGDYFAISKSGPLADKASAINSQLKAMASNGRVKAIYARYGLDPETAK